jgi:hypothetical protein
LWCVLRQHLRALSVIPDLRKKRARSANTETKNQENSPQGSAQNRMRARKTAAAVLTDAQFLVPFCVAIAGAALLVFLR